MCSGPFPLTENPRVLGLQPHQSFHEEIDPIRFRP